LPACGLRRLCTQPASRSPNHQTQLAGLRRLCSGRLLFSCIRL